jgi:bifunctional non-homologous end joining protein LigD
MNRMPNKAASLQVKFTHPDKVLYPEQGITKVDLARYYVEVADLMLPRISGRPLVLVRCPDGRHKQCFYQKHAAADLPEHLQICPVKEQDKTYNFYLLEDLAGLISLVQMGTLEIHIWGSKADKIEQPDRLIFDLDPDPSVPWSKVVENALHLKEFLGNMKLESFLKTTDGKGLHVVVPIARRYAWSEAIAFCRGAANAFMTSDPELFTTNPSKAARKHKIFIDYLRNNRGATSVAPYSTRSRRGATVTVPLSWDELSPDLPSDYYNIHNLPKRLKKLKHDPWEEINSAKQSLGVAMKKLGKRASKKTCPCELKTMP